VVEGMLKIVVIDTDACFKVGHIVDAFEDGLSNEGFQLQALRDRKGWKFGGACLSHTHSTHAANVDMCTKQCLPGEQGVVFSLTEIILRMMGESDKIWVCDADSRWEDVLDSSAFCDLLGEDGTPTSHYSPEFLHLVMTLRRRCFTQGGVDAFMDIHQARQLCLDFAAAQLQSTDAACMEAFALLVCEMKEAKGAAVGEDAEDEDGSPKDEDDEEKRRWTEVSEKDLAEYYVCPVNSQVRRKELVAYEMTGLVLRRRHGRATPHELLIKGPHLRGGGPRRACFGAAWWQRIPEVAALMDRCLKQGNAVGVASEIATALERAASAGGRYSTPIRADGWALCCCLRVSREELLGGGDGEEWPEVVLYPYSDLLKNAVGEALEAYSAQLVPNSQ